MVRALAVVVVLAALAPASAHAQCDPAGLNPNQVFGRELDAEARIRELETIKRQIEVENHIFIVHASGVVLLSPEQAGALFSRLILVGHFDPDSIVPEVRRMRAVTRAYIGEVLAPDLAQTRACLDRLRGRAPATPPPVVSAASNDIAWPAPMDWLTVRGAVRGTWVAECRDYRRAGSYRLEFPGDGRIAGTFEDDAYRYPIEGTIAADGTARGDARPAGAATMPFLRWSATFGRSGIELLMQSHTLDLIPGGGILIDCKPGSMRQEDRRAGPG